MLDRLTDIKGGVHIPSASKLLTDAFEAYLLRDDIDNSEANYQIGSAGGSTFPRYTSVSMYCGVPMDSTIQRRAFSSIYSFGDYTFLAYLAGEVHSPNALKPWLLRFARSNDLWLTYEELPIKCIHEGGVAREIDPDLDEFFPYAQTFGYADGKLWAFFGTFSITTLPPTASDQWGVGKTYATYSEDYGETWSQYIVIDNASYVNGIAKPIVVGDEFWIPTYSLATDIVQNQLSTIVRFNYVTETTGTKTQLDADWTGLSTTEPAILEYATGKYMCVARVNYNDNYEGEETIHKGEVIAYSTDGLDWSDYTWHDDGAQYPNEPDLFMYDGHVYYSRNGQLLEGTVAVDESEIEWISLRSAGTYWHEEFEYTPRQLYTSTSGIMDRYDPREGHEDELVSITPVGGNSFCVYDDDSQTLLATRAFKEDGGTYIGEPWVSIIKRSGVGAGPVYTERLIFATEIPGDSNTSNHIKLWSDWVEEGDTIRAFWYNVSGKPTYEITATATADHIIDLTSASAVTKGKIVFEIFK